MTQRKRFDLRSFGLGAGSVLAACLLLTASRPAQEAQAQVPDSGSQRQQMIRLLETSNTKLEEAVILLREIRDQGPSTRPGRKSANP